MDEFETVQSREDREHRRISPVPVITETDVAETLAGLEPGRYLSLDLWEHYLETMHRLGRGGVSRRAFGIALKAANVYPCMIYRDGATHRGWVISRSKDTVSEMPS